MRRVLRSASARMRLGLAGALLVGVLLVIVLGADEQSGGPSAQELAPPAGTGSPAPERLFGFSDHSWLETGTGGPHDGGIAGGDVVSWARGAGAGAHRFVLNWRQVEPRPGEIDEAFLARVKSFTDPWQEAGGKLLVGLAYAPNWAGAARRSGLPGPTTDTRGLDAWRRFVRFAAETFPDAVGFEIWNEPNVRYFWASGPDPSAYAKVANVAVSELRRSAPRARVVIGGLAGGMGNAQALGTVEFARRAVAAGLTREVDAVSWHLYPAPARLEQFLRGDEVQRFVRSVTKGLAQEFPGVPHWLTELGMTRTARGAPLDEPTQAVAVSRLLEIVEKVPEITSVFVHTLFDPPGYGPESPQSGFGLVRPSGAGRAQPRAGWCALRRIAATRKELPVGGRCPP